MSNIINELFRKGAEVIFQDTHVSGHACAEEIKLIYAPDPSEICHPGCTVNTVI